MAHIRETADGRYKIEVKRARERWYFTRDTQSAAERCARHAEVDLDEGRDPYDRYRIVRRPDGVTFGEWVERWQADRVVEPTTAARDHYTFKNRILPAFGHLLIGSEIDKLAVQRWVDRLGRRYKHNTVKTTFSLFRHVMADAEDCGVIDVTPCRRIRLGEPDSPEKVWLTPAQVVEVADACGAHGLFVVTLAWTGMRFSELVGVRRADVDVLRRVVRVDEPYRRARGVPGYHSQPKTRTSRRTIDLPPFLADALGAHLEHRHPYLFASQVGTPIWERTVSRYFRPAVTEVSPGATLHSLRHSHRTWLEEAMLPPKAIDARLGHASVGSRGRYTHVTPAMRKQTVEVLQRLWVEAAGPAAAESSG